MVETTLNLTLEEPEHIYLVDHAWTFQVGGNNVMEGFFGQNFNTFRLLQPDSSW